MGVHGCSWGVSDAIAGTPCKSVHLSMKFCDARLVTAQATAAALQLPLTEDSSLLKCRDRSAGGGGAAR